MRSTSGAEPVHISADGVVLDGDLDVPAHARSVVLFAHGSGSSRHSPRNRYVAGALREAGFATVLMDLLTADEDHLDVRTGELRFDIPLLARRLSAAVDWLEEHAATANRPVYLYGASTGAAAALITAAEPESRIAGVISRGGRPDLAGDALSRVRVPVLLIAGGADPVVCQLDAEAAGTLRVAGANVEEVIVPHAGHLFEESGTLDVVVHVTLQWLRRWQQAIAS